MVKPEKKSLYFGQGGEEFPELIGCSVWKTLAFSYHASKDFQRMQLETYSGPWKL